jgi:hypothetical protein
MASIAAVRRQRVNKVMKLYKVVLRSVFLEQKVTVDIFLG